MAFTEATPLRSVSTVVADSVADAPAPGAANVTGMQGSGVPPESRAITARGAANAAPSAAVWPSPPLMAVEPSVPAPRPDQFTV